MELKEAIEKFRSDLGEVKEGGKSQVEIDLLLKYLDGLAASAGLSAEQRRMQHENNLAFYNATNNLQVANFNAVMAAGKEAINASIIINGGAVIALMAFMGNVAGKPGSSHYVPLLSLSLLLFGMGTFCGGVAFGLRYVSQFLYQHASNKMALIAGHVINGASWVTTTSAFLAFAYAVFVAYQSLLSI